MHVKINVDGFFLGASLSLEYKINDGKRYPKILLIKNSSIHDTCICNRLSLSLLLRDEERVD